jgi:hypothetical protein
MAFARRSGAEPKHTSPEHRRYRAKLVAQLKRDGYLICTAKVCILPTRYITTPDGMRPDGLHAGHNDAGTDYDGPQHRACNVRDGAVRARARQNTTRLRW